MIEDESRDATLVQHTLKQGGFDFVFKRVETQESFEQELLEFKPSVILSDHGLPEFDGFTALRVAQQLAPEVPFIFVTGSLGEEMTIKALKSGATDFVLKHHLAALPPALHRALRQAEFQIERRQAEEALHSSEERYRSLVELSPDALVVLIDNVVVFSNSAGVRLFGAPHADALSDLPFLDLVHEKSRNAVGKLISSLQPDSKPLPFSEHRMVRLDGQVVHVEIAAAPLSYAGRSAAQVIVHDITEHKAAEEQIRLLNADLEERVKARTAELEEANKELEAFSYSVSHDLRAPLRHIEGFVEILHSTKYEELDEESQHHLRTIAESARQMGRLIDDLLAFSRTARAEVRKTSVNLDALVQTCIQDVSREAGDRNIEWQVDSLPEAQADAPLLRQVYLNLLANALKYTRTRPSARIEIGSRSSKNEHILHVKDNGVGFDMRYAHKLFGVFQRLHRASEFEGTGIGLANVRRIIARHGGRTWAEGEIDKGAVFYFSLPRGNKAKK